MAHDVQPDGYCPTCSTVPCRLRATPRGQVSGPAGPTQLDRIEHGIRKVLRHLGLEVEGD